MRRAFRRVCRTEDETGAEAGVRHALGSSTVLRCPVGALPYGSEGPPPRTLSTHAVHRGACASGSTVETPGAPRAPAPTPVPPPVTDDTGPGPPAPGAGLVP